MEILKQFDTEKRIIELLKNLETMSLSLESGKNSITLSNIEWVSPISLLPIVAFGHENKIDPIYDGKAIDVKNYLERIFFPLGTTHEFPAEDKDFLPITRLPCNKETPILDAYEDRILSNVHEDHRASFSNALKTLTSELHTNVNEHAKTTHYWLFSQYWKKTQTCEIAIADTGIGFKESYKGTDYEVSTHKEAIENVMCGKSRKYEDEGRGWGIRTIIKIFTSGYGGEVILMSGDSLAHINNKSLNWHLCPKPWKGAFVGVRFKIRDIPVQDYYR